MAALKQSPVSGASAPRLSNNKTGSPASNAIARAFVADIRPLPRPHRDFAAGRQRAGKVPSKRLAALRLESVNGEHRRGAQ